MKINKKEKMILLVVIAMVVLAVGYMLVFKPKSAELKDSKDALESAQNQKVTTEQRVATLEAVRKNIDTEYDNSKDLSDNFFPIMANYELDRYVQGIFQADALDYDGIELTALEATPLEHYRTKLTYLSFPLYEASHINSTLPMPSDGIVPIGEILASSTVTCELTGTLEDALRFFDNLQSADRISVIVKNCTVAPHSYEEGEEVPEPAAPSPEQPAIPQASSNDEDAPPKITISESNLDVTGIIDMSIEIQFFYMSPLEKPKY